VFNKVLINYSSIFVLDKQVSVLILGDSRTKYSLNDKILSNTCNFSNDADSYFYSYQKLKMISKKNKQINTLMLSFSQHNIDRSIEKSWLLNSAYISERNQIYYALQNWEDVFFLAQRMPREMFTGLFSQVLYPKKLLKGRTLYGGYSDLDHIRLNKAIEKYNQRDLSKEEKFSESPIEKVYLEKIKEYCQANGIKLILINTPLYKILQEDQSNLNSFYAKYFSDVPFLDFSKLEMPDSCYGDLVHLTPAGAEYFSKFIEKKGINNLLNAKGHILAYKP
jgi:hypothetical protein